MRRSPIFLLLVLALTMHLLDANAGYTVEQGKGVPVCEAYTENLNSFAPKGPFRQRPISPRFSELQKVDWNYPPDGLFPADGIVEFFWNRDANPFWYLRSEEQREWRGTPDQIANAKEKYIERIGTEALGFDQSVSFRVARVDMDNDGRVDYVVQYRPDPLTRLLLILLDDRSGVDHPKSQLVLRHAPWGDKSIKGVRRSPVRADGKVDLRGIYAEPVQDALHGATYEVFVYQGKTYYDLWWLADPSEAWIRRPSEAQYRLRVFTIANGRAATMCSLRFESAGR